MSSSEELKSEGNKYFVDGDFERACELYTRAIETFGPNATILTNRSAAYINLKQYEKGLNDANAALEIDKQWTKAYYRKAMALSFLFRPRDIYHCWLDAENICEATSWLQKQVTGSKLKWLTEFRQITVISEDDLLERYSLINEPREKLSTLAHFWNESNMEERFDHLQYFFSVIGGPGELSVENRCISVDMMLPMPLHNYEDLPRSSISAWCDYFGCLSSSSKTSILGRIWTKLNSEQQHAVIVDLKVFVTEEMQKKLATTTTTTSNTNQTATGAAAGNEEEDDYIDLRPLVIN